jgi:HlyD family secretion protein
MNNAGTMIMEVADLSQMVLRARVDEGAIADVKVGQKAKIRMEAYRGKVFDGVVQSVALANYNPQLARGAMNNSRTTSNDNGISFEVEILIDTQGLRIFSGLSADADIETHRYQDIVKVPSQAVLGRSPDSLTTESRSKPEVDISKATVPVVYRYIDGKAVETPVSIGASDLTHTVVKAGLNAGDPVIVGPYKALESLAQGKKVKTDKLPATQPSAPASPTTQSIAATQASKPIGS